MRVVGAESSAARVCDKHSRPDRTSSREKAFLFIFIFIFITRFYLFLFLAAAGGLLAPKELIGAGLAKFKNARDSSSSGGGESDEWDSD